MYKALISSVMLAATLFFATALADDPVYTITERNKEFSPQELILPAGQKVKIIVKNADATPAEFESTDLDREKIITPQSEITVYIGPLDAGKYSYFDDFHHESTGTIVVK